MEQVEVDPVLEAQTEATQYFLALPLRVAVEVVQTIMRLIQMTGCLVALAEALRQAVGLNLLPEVLVIRQHNRHPKEIMVATPFLLPLQLGPVVEVERVRRERMAGKAQEERAETARHHLSQAPL